ncbi:hypothetical protein ACFLTY_04380, partial [Chloroflexota bacterium]
WSGAKGPYLKNLKVAVCLPGEVAPELVQPSEGQSWRRDTLMNWIVKVANNQRILVGIDFSFAYPYCDKNAYFPGSNNSPKSVRSLWHTVDVICQADPNLYGGRFYKDIVSPFSRYLCYQTYKGQRFENNRLRRTEKVCESIGARPACTFKCVGPDQVGSGMVAGIRALHLITQSHDDTIGIWPFDDLRERRSTFVEIFPRLFFVLAKRDPRQWRDLSVVNTVLAHFNSEPLARDSKMNSEDDVDAIVSVAALRDLSLNQDTWFPGKLDEKTRQYEGWIFGCK